MRGIMLLVFLALSATLVTGILSEEKYGTDLARIHTQAEVNWVRDNHYIIFDVEDHSNKYVSSLNDDRLAFIIKHPEVRENIGIDKANLEPYLREVKLEEGLIEPETIENATDNMAENVTETNKSIEPQINIPKKILTCTARYGYDPFGLSSRLPVEALTRSHIGRRYCSA